MPDNLQMSTPVAPLDRQIPHAKTIARDIWGPISREIENCRQVPGEFLHFIVRPIGHPKIMFLSRYVVRLFDPTYPRWL